MSDNRDYVFLTLSEVAEKLNVTNGTVRNFINKGGLNAAKIGKSWRVKSTDLEAWIDEKYENDQG